MKSAAANQPSHRRFPAAATCGLFICFLMLLMSCAKLPKIQPAASSLPEGYAGLCDRPFVSDRWQFVHSVKAVLPNGLHQTMIGTTIVSPRENRIQCILLSIEGIVLLDVVSDWQVTVNRAVPPFDDPEMAQGMVRDVRLLFLKPAGMLIESGTAEDQAVICRYRDENENTIDVVVRPEGDWEIRSYDPSNRRDRLVQSFFSENQKNDSSGMSVPERLELTAYGFVGYKLTLDLIEAVPLFGQGPSA